MLGAIIGDIVGSRFEWNNIKTKDFEFLTYRCSVTDDSIMSLAVAKAILSCAGDYDKLGDLAVKCMQEVGKPYPHCGYGGMFKQWIYSDNPKPYNSYGNGAAMRVSACGFAATTLEEAKLLSKKVTEVTHNHPEGIKGAEATVVAIFMVREGKNILEIREYINERYYPMNFTLNGIRDTYRFDETCQGTVPQAIMAFLESTGFEDAIRNAISIGGDSDTLAAITGAIAEAYYGVPEALKEKALSYLNDELCSIFNDWSEFIGNEGAKSKFQLITRYIGKISEAESYGEWVIDKENDGTPEHPIQMAFVNFNELVDLFVDEFYQFSESHPEYQLTNYSQILENNGLKWDDVSMRNADVDALNEQALLALILGAIRAERFGDGVLLSFFKDGYILKWLKRLKEIDESNMKAPIAVSCPR